MLSPPLTYNIDCLRVCLLPVWEQHRGWHSVLVISKSQHPPQAGIRNGTVKWAGQGAFNKSSWVSPGPSITLIKVKLF